MNRKKAKWTKSQIRYVITILTLILSLIATSTLGDEFLGIFVYMGIIYVLVFFYPRQASLKRIIFLIGLLIVIVSNSALLIKYGLEIIPSIDYDILFHGQMLVITELFAFVLVVLMIYTIISYPLKSYYSPNR